MHEIDLGLSPAMTSGEEKALSAYFLLFDDGNEEEYIIYENQYRKC
jgi:hypothetical protein